RENCCRTLLDLSSYVFNSQDTLRVIDLHWCQHHETTGSSPVEALCTALDAIKTHNISQSVHLTVELDADTSRLQHLALSQWSRLDELLLETPATRYPNLQEVQIRFLKKPVSPHGALTQGEVIAVHTLLDRWMKRMFDASSSSQRKRIGGVGAAVLLLLDENIYEFAPAFSYDDEPRRFHPVKPVKTLRTKALSHAFIRCSRVFYGSSLDPQPSGDDKIAYLSIPDI
ncbi:hypothetical protein CVT24_010451, partial [Panaeolus cyanescens]